MQNLSQKLLVIPGVALGVLGALALSSLALDSELDTDDRVFAYNGFLAFQGERFEGAVDLELRVHDTQDPDAAQCAFTEVHFGVPVSSGAFTVPIGARTDGGAPDCLFDAQAMFLSIGVREAVDDPEAPNPPAFSVLDGLQRVHPVAASYWAAEGSDYNTNGGLTVGQTLNLNQLNQSAGGFEIRGTLSSQGSARLTTNNPVTVGGNTTISGDFESRTNTTTVNGPVTINGLANFTNGLTIEGTLNSAELNSIFTINEARARNISTNGLLTVGGRITATGGADMASPQNANLTVGNLVMSNDTLDVDGKATIKGQVNLNDCRLCLLASDNNQRQKGFACVRLKPGQNSVMQMRGDVNSDDHMGIAYLCDGVNTGSSNVTDNVTWPGD